MVANDVSAFIALVTSSAVTCCSVKGVAQEAGVQSAGHSERMTSLSHDGINSEVMMRTADEKKLLMASPNALHIAGEELGHGGSIRRLPLMPVH